MPITLTEKEIRGLHLQEQTKQVNKTMEQTSTMKTLKHWKKKPRKTQREKASRSMDPNRENAHFTKDNLPIQWNSL